MTSNTTTEPVKSMERDGDWWAFPFAIIYMFFAVVLLVRRYTHHDDIIHSRAPVEAKWCAILLHRLTSYWMAFVIFSFGVIALSFTEYVGGETSMIVFYGSLVGCFFVCLFHSYLQSRDFKDGFEDTNVVFKVLEHICSCRKRRSCSRACVLIRKYPMRFFVDLFFYLFGMNFCWVLFMSKANVHFDADENLCFTSWDSVENDDMDGGVGKLRPETELAVFGFLVYALGFYSAYFAFYRRVASGFRLVDISDKRNKHLLHQKTSEIELLSNAWTISEKELELTEKIDSGSTAVVWRGVRDYSLLTQTHIHSVTNHPTLIYTGTSR